MKLPPGKLYGRNLKTREVAGLRLAEVVYPAGYQTPEHSHDLPQLCLVRKGIFAEVYDRKNREVRPLSLITRPAGESHAQRFYESEVDCLIIEVEPVWLERVRERHVSLNELGTRCRLPARLTHRRWFSLELHALPHDPLTEITDKSRPSSCV